MGSIEKQNYEHKILNGVEDSLSKSFLHSYIKYKYIQWLKDQELGIIPKSDMNVQPKGVELTFDFFKKLQDILHVIDNSETEVIGGLIDDLFNNFYISYQLQLEKQCNTTYHNYGRWYEKKENTKVHDENGVVIGIIEDKGSFSRTCKRCGLVQFASNEFIKHLLTEEHNKERKRYKENI